MNDRQLIYFVRIADLGSFRRASEDLRIAQPALTRQIKNLEEELGVQLFNRGGPTIALTPAGVKLLERAKFIISQTEQARIDVISEGTIPSGAVRFGAPASISHILFNRLAKSYLTLFPQVHLRFVVGVGLLWKWLQSGEIDLAILPGGRLVGGGNLGKQDLVTERVYMVGPSGDFPAGSTCTSQELFSRPLILTPPPSTLHSWLDAETSKSGRKISVVAEAEGMQIQKDFVAAGLGYAVLPHSAIYPDFEAGNVSLSLIRGYSLNRSLAWRVDRPVTPAISQMIRMVGIEMRRLQEEGSFGEPPTDEPPTTGK